MHKLSFGQKLLLLRKNKKFSQRKLADTLEIAFSSIARYENDKVTPSTDVLLKLSELFDVSIDYLLKPDEILISIKDQEILTLAQRMDVLPEKNKEYIKKTVKQYLDDHE